MTASITIRLATKEDRESLSRLFHAIEVHYWGADAPTQEAVSAHVDRDILNSGCEMAIAECDGVAVGLTTFALLYPAPDLGGQLLMKDLFVTSDARGRGIGRALLEYLARLAVQRGCVRLDWTAETDNPRARTL
jgi:GNAT superfamily N-acetyltransferase